MATTRMITLRIPGELLEQVDALVTEGERTAFILKAVEDRLQRERALRAVEHLTGTVSEEEAPYWSTPERIVEWVREQRRIDAGKGLGSTNE